MQRVSKPKWNKSDGMDSEFYNPNMNAPAKKLSPKKADKMSKPIQKGRAAKGNKTKLLPRVSRSKKKAH